MGLGLLGGGVAVARFLAAQGAEVTVTDLKDAEALAESVAKLDGLPVELHLGGHAEADFTDADMVVVNPAVPDTSPFLARARDAGTVLETEINLFFKLCPAAIVGITGSNGKSTTASLVAHLLEAGERRVWLGGNIGRSLLEDIGDIGECDLVVLELSSFQLERLAWTGRSPCVSLVLNLTPNHLDRHGTFEAYERAKQPIVAHQQPEDAALLNADCPRVSQWGPVCGGRVFRFSTRGPVERGAWVDGERAVWSDGGEPRVLFHRGDLGLRGRHNVGNALAAAGAAALCGVAPDAIASRMGSFQALEHRLELVRALDGVAYYNDSKATTPEAAIAAVTGFDEPVVLIAGGYDKKLPFDGLGRAVAERARAAIVLGATAEAIEAAIAVHGDVPVQRASDIEAAVCMARQAARPGDVVLLSPACASYDMFANFEERGRAFKRLVKELVP